MISPIFQKRKIFELYEQLRQRIGVLLIGPSGSGKSTIWKLLLKILSKIKKPINVLNLNPKSMPRTRLLGHLDVDTREWFDGVITIAARRVVGDMSVHNWIVCDGDIDPEWIESLNSVLDDNKVLTMPSGERIQFGSNVNFIFETDNLSYASPATVSRMGIIYLSEKDVDIKEVIKHWLKEEEHNAHPDLVYWIDNYLYRCLDWIYLKNSFQIQIGRIATIKNALCQLRGNATSREQFLISLYRGLSPNLTQDIRIKFGKEVVFDGVNLPDPSFPWNIYIDDRTNSLSCYDNKIDMKLGQSKYEDNLPTVLTAFTQANRDSIFSLLKNGNRQPILLIGPDGCGKECLLRYCFSLDSDSHSEHLLQILDQHCVKISGAGGRILKPKEKANLLLYLKGLNLVKPDKWNTCELIAFLHQMLTYRGYYDEYIEWISLENIQLICSMNVIDDPGHYLLSPRFTSLLRIYTVDYPLEEDLIVICVAYLEYFLREGTFSSREIEKIARLIVKIFEELQAAFKTYDNPHYLFAPKDLTKWIIGITRYDIGGNDYQHLNQCVLYECQRLFRDRLINDEHKIKFDEILNNAVSSTVFALNSEIDEAAFNIPLFDEFVIFCSHIDRALTAAGGSILLAGRSGIGRKAATCLIAYMHQMKIFTPKISNSYSIKQFNNDLKLAIQSTTIDSTPTVIILEDYQIIESSFLQSINSILACGYIPGLFSSQEFDSFLPALRDLASQDAYHGDLHTYFASKVKTSLHIVLIMDVDAPDFSTKTLSAPSIFKHMAIIWKEKWNNDGLLQIPRMMLTQYKMNFSEEIIRSFVAVHEICPKEFSSPYKFLIFIKTYKKLFTQKKEALENRLRKLKAGTTKLNEARELISQMQQKAGKKSELLAEKQREADAALKAIAQSMTGANEQKTNMEELRIAKEQENLRMEEQRSLIDQQLQEVSDHSLNTLLNFKKHATFHPRQFGSIRSESLSEIRSLRAPPETIRDILQAVLLFMGILDTSWENMRSKPATKMMVKSERVNMINSFRFLAKSGVKEEIINFDARQITSEINAKVSTLVNSKKASFNQKNAKRASAAAAPLAAWVCANLQYASILNQIAPLERNKSEIMRQIFLDLQLLTQKKNKIVFKNEEIAQIIEPLRSLGKVEKQMEKLSKGMKQVDIKVAELKNNFEVLMKDATRIKIDLDREKDIIKLAGTLVDRLKDEFLRWNEEMVELQKQHNQLEKFCLISAAIIAFLGSAPESVRFNAISQWRDLLNADNFDFLRFCTTEAGRLQWKNNGLPSDNLSLENAIIIENTLETPLIIDPSGRISDFLQNNFQQLKIERLNASQPDLIIQLELGARFGKTLLIDDINDIEPSIMTIIKKDVFIQASRQVIQIDAKMIDYNENFRLFLCSKNDQISIDHSMKSVLMKINFTTTKSGLISQLLELAIKIDKPQLEARSNELTKKSENMKIQLEQLQQILLQNLALSEGNLLENNELLESLNKSKESSQIIAASLAESIRLQSELSTQRDVYLTLAEYASSVYFVIKDLYLHNHMYSFNVQTIINLFQKTFSLNRENVDETDRPEKLKRTLQKYIFENIARSLYEKDRLIFAMKFIRGTQPNLFMKNEWEFFSGVLPNEDHDDAILKNITWIDKERLPAVSNLYSYFPTLFNNIRLTERGLWSEFAKSFNCEGSFPKEIESLITPFQKVIIIQAIKPGRLHSAMLQFVYRALGIHSLNLSPFDFKSFYKSETSANEPILILNGIGADPSQDLEEFAKGTIGFEKFCQISMGQGQLQSAIEMMRLAAENGSWVCLKNLHLVIGSLSFVYKVLSSSSLITGIFEFMRLKRHENFRLWLTCEEDNRFPAILLQNSIKITYETPPGIKNNLQRIYAMWNDVPIQSNSVQLQYLFLLAWLHVVVQERRNYIPQVA
ncbi:unnamed protein product [Dracunculus medinensis]|uniref:AAA domain-containing protein n=1 Tax=Dracunculus medinensis TaxID=318479 RepID=A0A3P7TFQ1_DRAME|nr:unnamed protein product [Dracunculus medinensis]